MKKALYIALFFFTPFILRAQTTIYSQNFGTGTSLPTGWTVTAGTLFEVKDQTTDPPATGTTGSFLYATNTGTANQEVTLSGQVSTVGYTGIQVYFSITTGPDDNSTHEGFNVEWSADGNSWANLGTPFDIDDYNQWKQQGTISLPTSAENLSNLRFRFSFTAGNDAAYFALDDFVVTGTYSPPVFYNVSGQSITDLTKWGKNLDGSGVNPTSFTSDGQTFNLVNGSTATLTSALTISGTGSKLVVGDGTNAMNFTIPPSFSYSGTVDVSSSGTLTIANTNIPTLGTLAASSTVAFTGSSNQAVPATTYHNLTISSSSTATLAGSIAVNGALALAQGTLVIGSNTLTASGTISRTSGFIRGSATSNFLFNGSSGTIAVTGINAPRTFNNFTVSGSGSLTVATGALIINGRLLVSSGTFIPALASPSITIATANGYLTCSGTGVIQGNSTSPVTGILFTTTNSTNSSTLILDQTSTSTRSVNITQSGSGHTVNLGSNVIAPAFSQTAGTFVVGANTITFNSTNPTISGTFTCSSSSTVDFSSSPTQSVPAINYGNLTFSGTGQRDLPTSGTIGVSGTFTPGTNSLGNVASSTFDFNGTGAQTIPSLGASVSYNNLIISGTRTTNSVTLSTVNPINITGTFNPSATFSSGGYITTGSTVNFTGGSAQSVPVFNFNNLTIGGTRNANNVTLASGTIGVNGTLTVSPTFTSGNFSTTGNTISLTGSAQTIAISNLTQWYLNNLTVTGAGVKTLTSGNLAVNGVFNTGTASDRILSIGSNILMLNGSVSGSGLLRSNGSSRLKVGSSASLGTINFDQTTSGTTNSFQSLRLTGTNSQVTLGSALQITDTVDIAYTGATTALVSSGNLTLISTALKTAALYEAKSGTTSVSGNVNVQRYARASSSTPTTGHYFGSPVTTGSTATIYAGGGTTSNVLQYNESSDRQNTLLSGGYRRAGNATTMQVGRGYSKSWASNSTITFTGVLNNGSLVYTCTNTPTQYASSTDAGWNLLSNPYPSAIDWSQATTSNIQGDLAYLFNSSTGNYDVLNVSSSGYIETGRGFFVQAATGGGSVTFNNSMRVKNNNNSFSRLEEDTTKHVALSLVDPVTGSDAVADVLFLAIDEKYTNGFDVHDGRKLFGVGQYANIAFLLNKDSLVKQSIRPNFVELELPLFLKIKNTGKYLFKAKEFKNIGEGYSFYLKDSKATNGEELSEVTPESIYEFDYDVSKPSANRLSLIIKRNEIVTSEEDARMGSNNWIAYALDKSVVIKNSTWKGTIGAVEVLDMSGNLVQKEANVMLDGMEKVLNTSVKSGVYLVRIVTEKAIVVKKIVIQ